MTDDRLSADLDQMRRAASDATTFVLGLGKAEFLADRKTQMAVSMLLIVLGETARQITLHSPAFVDAHPDWPWREMIGLRNRAAHAYYTLDLGIIWNAATSSLPLLLDQINRLDG